MLTRRSPSEIKDALNLLWRNEVSANQVNLGLGFYGRSYTLSDANCWQLGCAFESAGHAGTCSVSISHAGRTWGYKMKLKLLGDADHLD
jgi:hypothetical protein